MSHYTHTLPSFTSRLWLLAALFSVLVPHLLRMPIALSLFCAAVFIWRLVHELRGISLPPRILKLLITLLGFILVAALFKTVLGRDAGVALLCIMVSLKLLELHNLRDALVTIYLGYFLVIGAFLFDQSLLVGAYLSLQVLLLTAALIALNHPLASAKESRFYLRYAGQMLLQSLPIMVILFLLFPRLNAPLWAMPQAKLAKTGLSDSIRMGTISSLVESEEVAFRVEFDATTPAADQLYWRGPVLWRTDGRLWQRMRLQGSGTLPRFESITPPVQYRVTIEPNGYPWLFALDLPTQLPQGIESTVIVSPDFQILLNKPVTDKLRYTQQSALSYRLSALDDKSRTAALQLPEISNPRTVAMAQSWRNSGLSDQQLIDKSLAFFRDNDFYYSRQPPILDNHPVDDFMFNTRRGFCEHYATSFVTLMRAAGIPARVVTGYQGGERNPLGNYLIVRQSNAHAWAEVWLPDQGWVRIDPTFNIPASHVEDIADSQRFSSTDIFTTVSRNDTLGIFKSAFYQLRHFWDSINHGWNQWVMGFDREQQKRLLKKLGLSFDNITTLLVSMIITIFLFLVVVTLYILRRSSRIQDPVQLQYLRFCKKLASQGVIRLDNEGPHDFSHRACVALPERCEQISAITVLYVALRYSNSTVDNDLLLFKQRVKEFS